jgi:hypothetical protein
MTRLELRGQDVSGIFVRIFEMRPRIAGKADHPFSVG